MSARLVGAAASVVALFGALPSPAAGAPQVLTTVASRSVRAAEYHGKAATAFAYGSQGGIIGPGASSSTLSVITSDGSGASGQVLGTGGGITFARMPGLTTTPLREARERYAPAADSAFVIGPPLGYAQPRIRRIAIGRFDLSRRSDLVITGTLPAAFAGAPVLNARGELLGAVAQPGTGHWKFAALGVIRAVARSSSAPAGGSPLLTIVLVLLALAVTGVAVGLLRERSKRQRAERLQQEREARMRAARRPPNAPLVRLRDPTEGASPDDSDDFEVVIKPHDHA